MSAEQCPYCGLQYGGHKGMRLDERSINGRTRPYECMCGAIYDPRTSQWVRRG